MHTVKPKYEYCVLDGYDINTLTKRVNHCLNNEWECHGNMEIKSRVDSYGTIDTCFYQPMLREIRNKKK